MAVGAEAIFGESLITTKLDSAIAWARESSMWPYIFGTACCAIEFMSVASSKYDISRFGAEVVRFSPRQADLLIIAGTISYKQAHMLKTIPPCKVLIASFLCMFMLQDALLVRKHF